MIDETTQPATPPDPHAGKIQRATVLAAVSLGLAVVATLWLALWPYSYSGTEMSSDGGVIATHASFIQINGFRVLAVMMLPLGLTVIGFLLAKNAYALRAAGRVFLLICPILLLLFCLIASFSIGVFYFPSAVLLLIASLMAFGNSKPRPENVSQQ